MSVMRRWAYQCPDCGGIGQHAQTCSIFPLGIVDAGNRVEVVPLTDHRGAVGRLERAETLLRELCHREGNPRAVRRTMDDVREFVGLPRLEGR